MSGSVVTNKCSRWSVKRGSGVTPYILAGMNLCVLEGISLLTLRKAWGDEIQSGRV